MNNVLLGYNLKSKRQRRKDMIIDWEHHYLPEELFIKKGGKKGERVILYENGKPRTTLQPEVCDVEGHLRIMDAAGIDIALLTRTSATARGDALLEETKFWNDKTAEMIKGHPKRFFGLAPIPPLGGKKALEELERAVTLLGFKGAIIYAQPDGVPIDSKELWPFYKKVSSLRVPIVVHPSLIPLGFDVLDGPYDLRRSVGRELDLIVATTRIILGGVLDEFSDLTFVMSHKGGGIGALKERIEYWFDAPGSPGTLHKKHFHEHFDRIYFNLAGHHGGMNSVKNALLSIHPTRIVFGSDYPQEFMDDPENIKTYVENLKKLDIGEENKELILGGNARRLLGI
jgi:predicted TIM-barrel fold metal-dependent hydrolase